MNISFIRTNTKNTEVIFMDENIRNDQDQFKNENVSSEDRSTPQFHDDEINHFKMDNTGNVRTDRGGGMAVASSSRTFLVIAWISAALAAFVSPYFAISGIVFGVLANRQAKGSGTAVIITNVVLAAINLLFGFIIVMAIRRILFRY
jgi:hypothetical protein